MSDQNNGLFFFADNPVNIVANLKSGLVIQSREGFVKEQKVRIQSKEKKTIILVTHDLSEAISMADRVLILSRRPATVQEIVSIHFADSGLLPMERRQASEFKQYFNEIWKELNVHGSP